jgi:hypothetical protein
MCLCLWKIGPVMTFFCGRLLMTEADGQQRADLVYVGPHPYETFVQFPPPIEVNAFALGLFL